MCGRFSLFQPQPEIERRFSAEFTFDYEPRYNIAPEGSGIATIQNENSDEINRLQWGLLPNWVDEPGDFPTLINARAESVAEKPSFKSAFENRRCLIPASNFYEWTGRKGNRVPYAIGLENQDLFTMAGVWETWPSNGTEIQSVAIITTEANDIVSELHDRMPVILAPDEEERWLAEDDLDELQALLDPFPDEGTRSWEVSRAVNNPGNDGPELVGPLGSDQAGLEEFG